jgi:diguanylate cyclase (GGDEF)-like protein
MATILLVDERDANRVVLAALLRQKGHRLLETADSGEAKDILRTERPDVVITDVLMAAMNGFPFAVSSAGVNVSQPRFIFSAPRYLMAETRRLAQSCGISHVIAKPVEPQEVLDVVSAALLEPPVAPAEAELRDRSTIESHLGSISESMRRHVVELEEVSRKLEQRAIESTAQLETARAALKEEVSKRLVAEEDLTQANRRLHEQAMRDSLTGLYNRRYLMDFFERELHRARRGGERLGVMMIDIDHFKRCNDTFGHAAGDAVLSAVAKYMLSLVRGEDMLCRYGGEEFVLVQAKASPEAVMQRAERFREGTRNLDIVHDGRGIGPVTLSIGIAMFPDHAGTSEALLQVADIALYRAKDSGRNRVVMSAGETAAAATAGSKAIPERR